VIWKETFRQEKDTLTFLSGSDAVFPLASLTKSMSATVVMKLVEKGQVSLEDPVEKYLANQFANNAGRSTTLRELLNMTGGIPHGWITFDTGTSVSTLTNEQFLKEYSMSVFPKGVYEYSNYAFGLVEAILERATGKSYDRIMQEELFEPLGMNHSYIPGAPMSTPNRVDPHGNNRPAATFYPSGAAGTHSTVSDMIRYAQFHLGNTDPSMLSTASLHQMHFEKIYPTTLTSLGWGSIPLDDSLTWLISNGSFRESANSNLTIIPSEKIGVICLADRDYQSSADVMAVRIADVLLPGFADKAFGIIEAYEAGNRGELLLDGADYSAWEGFIRTGEKENPIGFLYRGDSLFVSSDQEEWQPVRNVVMDQQSIIRGNITLPLENPISNQTVLCPGNMNLLFQDQKMQGYFSANFREDDQYYLALPFYIEVWGKD
jgi:CubicO group peptidase (beta-lactamase class C family)